MMNGTQSVQDFFKKKYNAEFTEEQAREAMQRLINLIRLLAEIKSENEPFPTSGVLSLGKGELRNAS